MRPGRIVVFVLVVGATRLVGCGSTVDASRYDQSCTWASDCFAVGVGDPCSTPCMEFPSADAISRTSGASYGSDAVEAQYSCSHCGSTLGNCTGNSAASKSAYCNAGTCTVCDDPDSCKCAPKDPTCGATGSAGIPDAGTEGGKDAAAESSVATDTGTGTATDAPSETGMTEAGPEGDGATDAHAGD
jgi:hypothetical protein